MKKVLIWDADINQWVDLLTEEEREVYYQIPETTMISGFKTCIQCNQSRDWHNFRPSHPTICKDCMMILLTEKSKQISIILESINITWDQLINSKIVNKKRPIGYDIY